MSNLTPRGTIKGVIRSGGGGGVTDYDQLTGRPSINNELVTGDKGGHDYGLMNSNDINITKIVDLTYGTNYDLEILDDHVYITDQVFQPAGVSSNGTKGLVPRPSAGDNGKILSNEGWINLPQMGLTIDTLWSGSETPVAGNPFTTTIQDISNYKAIIVEGYSASELSHDQSIIFNPQINVFYESYQYGDGGLYWRLTNNTTIELSLFSSANPTTYTRVLGIK